MDSEKTQKKEEYDASSIQVLGSIEAVRKRPSMYIGDTGVSGLHHLVFEVVDNSIDEAMVGCCKEITIVIHPDNSVSVIDDGRGIPVDIMPKFNKPALEIIMTKLHSGGKFDNKAYKVSGGLHGVGLSVVNALSSKLIIEVRRNSKIHTQRYELGKPVTPLDVIGESQTTGTTVTFMPDKDIFESLDFSFDRLSSRLRELAFLNPGLRIILEDERIAKKSEFLHKGGIKEFVHYLNSNKTVLHEPMYFQGEKNSTRIEIAMQYNDGYLENILSFANNINTIEGGTHLSGFKTALTRTLNNYSEKNKLLEKD